MSSLSISCTVDRAELSLAPLELENPEYYRVVQTGPGVPNWKLTWVSSPNVEGAYLTAATREIVSMPLTIRVEGTSASTLGARLDELYEAFSQFSYIVQVQTGDDAGRRWSCYPATFSVGDSGSYNAMFLLHHWQHVHLDIPRHPIALQGAI